MKSVLGQFYTTNYQYILHDFYIPDEITAIIEPFAGNGDLLKFIKNRKKYNIECYDIDPKQPDIVKRDTLMNPPLYDGKFVLTNPPYLARNKNKDKTLYDRYECNDLYKCFIKSIANSGCIGGIMIIPLNFISSIRKSDIQLRKQFLKTFNIIKLNIFEEPVFDDTNYSVCSIQFEKSANSPIDCIIYPSKKNITLYLHDGNNYTIGGEIYTLPISTKYKIDRATKNTPRADCITNILVQCIDNNIHNQIQLKIVKDADRFIDNTPKLSARSYATLVITPPINNTKQENLVLQFNTYIQQSRDKYHSLFLTNYRESNTIARKRISFDLVYKICYYLLDHHV